MYIYIANRKDNQNCTLYKTMLIIHENIIYPVYTVVHKNNVICAGVV